MCINPCILYIIAVRMAAINTPLFSLLLSFLYSPVLTSHRCVSEPFPDSSCIASASYLHTIIRQFYTALHTEPVRECPHHVKISSQFKLLPLLWNFVLSLITKSDEIINEKKSKKEINLNEDHQMGFFDFLIHQA